MSGNRKAKNNKIEFFVIASQSGDRCAFDELVRIYERDAMKVAIRLLGNANDASEAVQQGFVKAYLNIHKLKDVKSFGAWLFQIVTNAAISQRRTMKTWANGIGFLDSYEDKRQQSPVQEKMAQELEQAISEAMLKLSAKEAKAISLFGLEGLSHKQTAKIMGCSAATAKWYVFAARKKLKVILKNHLD